MTVAYYNEIDGAAAQWLRNLIEAGHIAPGYVLKSTQRKCVALGFDSLKNGGTSRNSARNAAFLIQPPVLAARMGGRKPCRLASAVPGLSTRPSRRPHLTVSAPVFKPEPDGGLLTKQPNEAAQPKRRRLKNLDSAVEMYHGGASLAKVAEAHGVSRQAMWKSLVRRNVEMRPKAPIGAENHFFVHGDAAISKAAKEANLLKNRSNRLSRRRLSHGEKERAAARAWKKANSGKVVALVVKRNAEKLRRTPAWLSCDDLLLVQEIYKEAQRKTAATGESWQVDHVIPLRGARVSGLHVPSNLQIILAIENQKKGNRFTQ